MTKVKTISVDDVELRIDIFRNDRLVCNVRLNANDTDKKKEYISKEVLDTIDRINKILNNGSYYYIDLDEVGLENSLYHSNHVEELEKKLEPYHIDITDDKQLTNVSIYLIIADDMPEIYLYSLTFVKDGVIGADSIEVGLEHLESSKSICLDGREVISKSIKLMNLRAMMNYQHAVKRARTELHNNKKRADDLVELRNKLYGKEN